MPTIKTKEVYLHSVRQVDKGIRHINRVSKQESTSEQTPEEYASHTVEKRVQETSYYTGIKAVRRMLRKKKHKDTAKSRKKFQETARITVKKAILIAKVAGKAVVKATQAVVKAGKALITSVIEGGWIALAVVLAVCLICGILATFAILFSEDGSEGSIQAVATSQIGNIGGEPYWSWYGYTERVEWCACFVSWCAEQCGYIREETFPKFSACVDGVDWFKEQEQWQDTKNVPLSGMIIFFDWDNINGQDGEADHVGIVKSIENGLIYTVEGNSNDSVKVNQYPIGHYEILGYGVPEYIMKTAAIP